MNRVEATGQWQGGLAGANVEVSLVSPHDPRAARLEHLPWHWAQHRSATSSSR